ncbi:hypothetical protein NC653_007653 [Populus alba x Populus x berolinensis]|uniref:Uncharacterized protein n=1 Tax=Populus alba x Populus x berolinensis TaxID=444605 RepID=A0AAD6RHE5_9ROSI|nr:hypothetical protein NC653_007653 [Populus alba x Populus x berolinensis]
MEPTQQVIRSECDKYEMVFGKYYDLRKSGCLVSKKESSERPLDAFCLISFSTQQTTYIKRTSSSSSLVEQLPILGSGTHRLPTKPPQEPPPRPDPLSMTTESKVEQPMETNVTDFQLCITHLDINAYK